MMEATSSSFATLASYHAPPPEMRSFSKPTTFALPIDWPSLMMPSTQTMPRSFGSRGARPIIILRWWTSVVTTTASESARMYSTSASWSLGSSGTTETPAPDWAR